MKKAITLLLTIIICGKSYSQFIGIGTNSPKEDLHLHSSIRTDVSILITNNTTGAATNLNGLRIRMNSLNSSISNNENGDLHLSTNKGIVGPLGAAQIWLKPTGAVGIGTSSPSAKLEVAGQVKITGGSPGAGKVLTSDATGLATWGSAAGTYYTVFRSISDGVNTSGNSTTITYSGAASTDILMVTPFWDNVYVNSPIGVYWVAPNWLIFRQDLVAMPLGAKFNVMVIKP